MPRITDRESFDGGMERVARLGLQPLWLELEKIIVGFELLVEERRDANGAAEIRDLLDQRFRIAQGWKSRTSGGVDWTKCHAVNGTSVCLGVEVQFSGRSDLLIVDVVHLRDEIIAGRIDVGVIVAPRTGSPSSSPIVSRDTRMRSKRSSEPARRIFLSSFSESSMTVRVPP